MAGLLPQLQGLWLVNKIMWFSLVRDDFCRRKDINAEHESYFRLHFDTGLVYPVQGSRDLVWKTTLDISRNIQMVSHQDGEPFCQIVFQSTWILYADSMYQSKYLPWSSVDTFVEFLAHALMPEHIFHPRTVMGTRGNDDGNGSRLWTKEYYYTMLMGYRVLDRWVFPLSWDLNFTQNYAFSWLGYLLGGSLQKEGRSPRMKLIPYSPIYLYHY